MEGPNDRYVKVNIPQLRPTCDTIAPVYIRKGKYKEIRKRLAHVDGKGKMKNKTSRECWTILRSEPDSAIDRL